MKLYVRHFVVRVYPLVVEIARYSRLEYRSFLVASRYVFPLKVMMGDIHRSCRLLIQPLEEDKNNQCIAPFFLEMFGCLGK